MKEYDVNRKLILNVPLSKNRTFKIEIQALKKECFAATLNEVH